MRLLQTMAGAHHGGAEAFFERLAIALQHAGVAQRLVIRRDAERSQHLRAAHIEVVELPFGGMLDFKTRSGLRHVIHDFKPDVILSWMNRATKLTPRFDGVHAARLGGYYNLKYYQHCDHLIGNTRGIIDYIRKSGWPSERAHYLPNFVSDARAAALPRINLGVPENAPLALALGRLHANKGFDVLLTAMVQAPSFHLWVAGEGPEHVALQAQVDKLGLHSRVHLLGWRQNTAALLETADMLVCPSRIEPLGNVVIEAWAAKRPVIAAASDGPRELIHDGENGILVPTGDADALARAMNNLAAKPERRQRLADAGRKSYESEFSEARVVGLYKEFFEKVKR